MEPCAIVRMCPAPCDHWNAPRLAAFGRHHLTRPAAAPAKDRLHDEEMNGTHFCIRKNDVLKSVIVYVDEPQTIIAALGIADAGLARQAKRKPGPALFFRRPGEDGVLSFVSDKEFAGSVFIEVAKPYAAITIVLAGEDRFTLELESIKQGWISDPALSIKSPGAAGGFVSHEHHRQSIR